MADCWNQYWCPRDAQGKIVAEKMNIGHLGLTKWGLGFVNIQPDFCVLDVGCGGGRTLGRLAGLAFEGKVFGVDHSELMVAYSRELNKRFVSMDRVEVVRGSVEALGFKDDFFDLVTAIETYYFWLDIKSSFEEIRRVLKSKGFFVIISEMIKDGIYDVKYVESIKQSGVRLFSLSHLQSVLYLVGFEDVKIFRKPNSAWNVIVAKK